MELDRRVSIAGGEYRLGAVYRAAGREHPRWLQAFVPADACVGKLHHLAWRGGAVLFRNGGPDGTPRRMAADAWAESTREEVGR